MREQSQQRFTQKQIDAMARRYGRALSKRRDVDPEKKRAAVSKYREGLEKRAQH